MILAFALITSATVAEPTPSQVLAENRLALQLWPDEEIRAIYAPYFDCYWNNVKDKPDSNLEHLELGDKMFAEAFDTCAPERQSSDLKADQYLETLQDYAASGVRADTIPRYRRQAGMIILFQHYHDVGKGDLINNYMAEAGHRSRKQ